MTTVEQSRASFGTTLRALRANQYLTLRGLQERTGVCYALISAFERGERALGSDVATRLADGLNLAGEERQRFLFAAAATRRRDRLVGYARTLAPELINFVPHVLAEQGFDLETIQGCQIARGSDERLSTRPGADRKQGVQAPTGDGASDRLEFEAGGKRYVCTCQISLSA